MVQLNIVWYRHLHSCSNLADVKRNLNLKEQQDPPLADLAFRLARPSTAHVDLVISSVLFRTMETAAFVFPGHKIVVAPYIKEASDNPESIPIALADQKARAKHLPLDWSYVSNGSSWARGVKTSYDLKKFLAFLPRILADHFPNQPSHLNIAIVSHALFIERYFKEQAHNLGRVTMTATWEGDKITTWSKKGKIEGGHPIPDNIRSSDVERCERK